MFPFWEKVVAPILGAAQAKRLVEIGALRGEQTQLIVDQLGQGHELHVIDPVPDFDPAEHRTRFGDGYHFHRALSLDVLGDLPPMDAALVDGDHNWYTVYHELRLLREVARAHDAPLPVLILHDVLWPYGRRDLYYDPSSIPAEHRQEYRYKGMRPGSSALMPIGGLNPTMANATHEGGPRNGVMTGFDDFVAEHDRPIRTLVLPIYFGLAIAVEEERLERQPELAALLDHLESKEGRLMLLELSESIRIDAMLFQHAIYFNNEAKHHELAERYLRTTKAALANEHHLENDLRLSYLIECVEKDRPVEAPRLRDPVRHDPDAWHRLREERRTGRARGSAPGADAGGFGLITTGRLALDQLQSALDHVRSAHVLGDLVFCGVGRGGPGILGRAYLDAYDLADARVWLVDRFRAAPDDKNIADISDGLTRSRPDLNTVRDAFDRFDVLDDRCHFLQGDLSATLPDSPVEQVSLLHLGPLTPAETSVALDQLYWRLAPDAAVVVDDASDPEIAAVIEKFRDRNHIEGPAVGHGTHGLTWRRSPSDHAGEGDPVRGGVTSPTGSRSPLAPPAPTDVCDLSVVVVMYDMAREAERTLLSLSRSYQIGIDDLDYEVLVIENGTDPERALSAERVARFGPEFRYLSLGEDADPSPAGALNRGVEASRGRRLALMVDGAHVLTPGVLKHAMVGLDAYAPAVVAVQPWYVGPGQQGEAIRDGYDQSREDELFQNVNWPSDGYRLFEVGHFQGDRDWLDGLWESNCLIVPRSLLEQVGGFDEGFDTPGGGYTNLDIYERLGATPGVRIVSLLGEGSFHQVHGGTTTNVADPDERRARVFSYGTRYSELRGRAFTGPEKRIHYVGSFHGDSARRTRARRMTGAAFEVDPSVEGPDGPLTGPQPIPDDLRDSFLSAYWRSLAWQRTGWLGSRVHGTPTDLITYQELVNEVRPKWIIETGTRHGGRTLFLAHLCDQLGSGRVISIDSRHEDDRPSHDRIIYLDGRAHEDDVVAQVRSITGGDVSALVILGTRGAQRRMHLEFRAYEPFVPVGSYIVMENTILNGYPVNAAHGPGPFEAVRRILNIYGDFVADTRWEKHGLSFNVGGFLRRIS